VGITFGDIEISRVRDYWNSRPCNIRHSTAPIGTKEYFDQVEARKYFVEYHIQGFADFERWRGRKVLEIGCGIGTDTINFARAGAQVTTVDLSDESIELARKRAAVFRLEDRIRFCPGNAEQLSAFVPVEPYDLIYSFGVIHHTPHPEAVLEQLRQYTRPGTTIKIMVYHRRSWKVAWILLTEGRGQFWKLRELVAKNSEAQTGCPVTYTYARREGCELLERHGFRVTNVEVEHIFPIGSRTTLSISTSKSGISAGCRRRSSGRSSGDWAGTCYSRRKYCAKTWPFLTNPGL
jgi:2-polyprenyl-3-methyl-5-hydroxy-6-metoxy-1,4-benzoquinol methylase